MNGWQRLWCLLMIVWSVVYALLAVILRTGEATGSQMVAIWLLWAVPPAIVYALGAGVAWVRRGFGPVSCGDPRPGGTARI